MGCLFMRPLMLHLVSCPNQEPWSRRLVRSGKHASQAEQLCALRKEAVDFIEADPVTEVRERFDEREC